MCLCGKKKFAESPLCYAIKIIKKLRNRFQNKKK